MLDSLDLARGSTICVVLRRARSDQPEITGLPYLGLKFNVQVQLHDDGTHGTYGTHGYVCGYGQTCNVSSSVMSSWLLGNVHSLFRPTLSVRLWFFGHELNVITTVLALLIASRIIKLVNGIRVGVRPRSFEGILCPKIRR